MNKLLERLDKLAVIYAARATGAAKVQPNDPMIARDRQIAADLRQVVTLVRCSK